ncbi:MAG: hypothetical protein WC889_06200 [Myxococcota bacterium]
MSFHDELAKVCGGADGALICTLMSFDGIPVDTAIRQGSTEEPEAQAAMTEIALIARQLKTVMIEGGHGTPSELTVSLPGCLLAVRPLTDEYFMALAVSPGGNFGKGRYLLRVSAPKVLEELQ